VGSRWVVTGSNGQLGRALVRGLGRASGCEVVAAVDIDDVDVADPVQLRRFFDGLPAAPDVVVNAAAFTQVDRCEREPELAERGNATAPGLLAALCREAGVRLVHVSTDYVFAGDADRPYTEADVPAPRSAYGRTKLEGERRVLAACDAFLVVRTSWVFGDGRNFIAAILAQARERRRGTASGPLRVVDDQRGRPTYAVDLAEAILGLVERGARGVYHVANQGVASWWDLARAALDEAGYDDLAIERIRTADLKVDAPRPAWSVLDCAKAEALGVRLRSWREALRSYLASEASPLRAPGGAAGP
jgi:dTDP-4-dehydrorhamnose reductase